MDTLATARKLLLRAEQEQPRAVELACLASFAVRVDPPLLRRLRLELLPHSSPAIEAELWLGGLVTFRGPEGFVFARGVASLLRERLALMGEGLYEKAWKLTRESHHWLAAVLTVEEELNYLQFSRAPDAFERARTRLQSILSALAHEQGAGLSHWAAGASARLPSEFLTSKEGGMLVTAAGWLLQDSLVSPAPSSEPMPGWVARLVQDRLERVRVGVRMYPGYVELGFADQKAESTIEVPRTFPLVVEVAEPAEETSFRRRKVFISASRRADQKWREEIAQALGSAHHTVVGDDPFKPGESLMSVVEERLRQSDAAILLISKGALTNEWNAQEPRALLEKKRQEGDRFTLLPVYLWPATPTMLAGRWPDARELLSFQGIQEGPSDSRSVTARILEALESEEESVKAWRRIELHPPRPHRIPLQAGRVRLRTVLGDEYTLEPMEPSALLRMPPPPPVFVSRERELSEVLAHIDKDLSLLVIHGPSGVGKTEFMRQVAANAAKSFPGGMFYVDGRWGGPWSSARAVAREVLRALDPGALQSHRDELASYRELSTTRRFLLALDGFLKSSDEESMSMSELHALVPGPGSLLILTGQQEPQWERLPSNSMLRLVLGGLEHEAAIHLLKHLSPRVGQHAGSLAQACGHLPGPLRQVAEVLTRRPELPVSDYASLLERARVLSVFPETFELEAARAVLESEVSSLPPMLRPKGLVRQVAKAWESGGVAAFLRDELVRFGLVQPAATPGRFELWPPLRQIAEARDPDPEFLAAEGWHASHYADVLERLESGYAEGDAARAEAIDTFDWEWPNMAAAFERLSGDVEKEVVRIELLNRYSLAAGGSLMRLRRPPREREHWHRVSLEVTTAEHPAYEGNLLGLALALADLGLQDEALSSCERAVDVSGDRLATPEARSINDTITIELARLYVDAGRWTEARELHEAFVLRPGEESTPSQIAQARYVSACLARHSGVLDEAEWEFETAREWAARAADVRLEVDALLGLAGVMADRERLGIAGARYIEAMELARDYRDERGRALGCWEFGRLRVRQGDLEVGREFMQRLVDYRRSIGHAQAESTARELEQVLRDAERRGKARRQVGPLVPYPRSVFPGHDGWVTVARFSPDGQRILTAGSKGNAARLWDARSGDLLSELREHNGPLLSARFSPDGRRVLTANTDGTASVYLGVAGQIPVQFVLPAHSLPVTEARFSPDGQFILTASEDGTARLWSATTADPLTEFRGHARAVTEARFSPDGQRILTASDDQTARLWDASTGKPLAELLGHSDVLRMASFSSDGQSVLTASDDATARIWNVFSGPPLVELLGHSDWVYVASFSPDGQRVLTASEDGTARIWDASTGKPLVMLGGHSGPVTAACFSPDGQWVLTASEDGTARIRESLTGAVLTEIRGDFNWRTPVCFSPDGRCVLTAHTDGVARLWELSSR